jgi:hypothetical protein
VHTAEGRVRWQGLAMAGRTSMSQRIERILTARPASSLRLTQLAVALLFVLGPLLTVSLAVVEPTARAISRISLTTPPATRLNNVTVSSLAGIWQGELGPIRISVQLKQYPGNLTGKLSSWIVQSRSGREFRFDINSVPRPPPPPPPPGGRIPYPRLRGNTLTFAVEPLKGIGQTEYRLSLETRDRGTLDIILRGGVKMYPALEMTKVE